MSYASHTTGSRGPHLLASGDHTKLAQVGHVEWTRLIAIGSHHVELGSANQSLFVGNAQGGHMVDHVGGGSSGDRVGEGDLTTRSGP
jgi:hypothetical protein